MNTTQTTENISSTELDRLAKAEAGMLDRARVLRGQAEDAAGMPGGMPRSRHLAAQARELEAQAQAMADKIGA